MREEGNMICLLLLLLLLLLCIFIK